MKQFSFCVDETHSLAGCLDEFLLSCPKKYSSILALVFTSQQKSSSIWEMLDEIRARVPGVQIAGATSAGEIVDAKLHLDSTVLTFLVFEKATVRLFAYDFNKIHPDDIGTVLLGQCRTMPELSGVCLLGTLKGKNIGPLMGIVSQLAPEVEVFGCGATAYDTKGLSYVLAQDMLLADGMVAVCMEGAGLKIQVDSQLGWRPLGKPMKVTDVFSGNIITELDKKPAVSAYKNYLGIEADDSFVKNAMSFPLLLLRDGHWLARYPDACTRDGSIIFSADFEAGDLVWLSYGDPNEIRRLSRRMGESIRSFSPQAVLTFSSSSRRQFLAGGMEPELSSLPPGPAAGFYSYGEILRWEGRVHRLYSSMIAVSLREGEADAAPPPADAEGEDIPLSTAERLAIFVGALTD